MSWLEELEKRRGKSIMPLEDPVDEWIDYAIDLVERAAKRLLPWVVGILIGLILGYAWRVVQTGGL